MGELRMHALSIHEVRDMFGADAELAGRLRAIASDTFRVPAAEQRPRGLLGKLGPVFRSNPGPVVPDGTPLPSDWETLIRGHYVAPERLEVSWKVVDAWVDALDWQTWHADLGSRQLDDLDFALTKAGLPSRFGLRKLMADDPQLPLRAANGMRIGYSKSGHVTATAAELGAVLDRVEGEENLARARSLHAFLSLFPGLAEQARGAGRPGPDLFLVWWETPREQLGS
ncbi:hypothetical protein [Aestuariimicrobium kwangyangense]|uniref:hypothetical protein n=1 Tax=Aestuariimicrobium kwangyangense TaxID=396389 RepID=UPI0003B51F6F|nr:hypothetical protein [Aestuariimicrobium kwangyangense]